MALDIYRQKRDFRRTPEPSGATKPHPGAKKAALSFVIQKHAARRLHYDFRLELDGVLKSWAIPKGPSLDPHEKRLAVEVEDHPLEYGRFEGIIPQGEYGGGTVLLWDRGTWEPLEADPDESLAKGMLKFALHGDKLHGNWMLVRLKRRPRDRSDNWLLVKERDEAAIPGSGSAVVDELTESVESHRTIGDIAADRDRVWHSKSSETPGEETAASAKLRPLSRIKGTKKATMPASLKPQLATAAAVAPGGDEWLHEIKYDGYRLVAYIDGGRVRLVTRGGLDWTEKFPALASRLAKLPIKSAILDGELVALRPDGISNFADLQDAISAKRTGQLTYFAFDLLYRDGWDLTGVTLEDRKAALAELVPPRTEGMLRYSDHHVGQGPDFLKQAADHGVEGIVAKRRDKSYELGRGRNWLKIKSRNHDEFIVVGFTDPDGSREGFGALLLGYYDPSGALRYAGRVGSGFTGARLAQLYRRLSPLETRKAPITLPPAERRRKDIHWVKPELVVEVEYACWTTDRLIRQSTFQGLREDKPLKEIVYDPEKLPAAATPPADPPPAAKPAEKLRDGSIIFNGVRLSHPDRVLYADTGLTKQQVAQYWVDIADWALPHLAYRPLTIIRETGAKGQRAFYQKHVGVGMPSEIKGRKIAGESERLPIIEDVAGLIALAQVGVVEIHPWGSRADSVERPDRVTFDLDPDEGLAWDRVIEGAIEVRDALDAIGLRSFAKTTGGKGLHVVVPLQPKLDWEAVKAFTKWVADRMHEERPAAFTANMTKRERRGRIYLDYLRNSRGATAVGAYSPRDRAGTPVSTPLSWDEVERQVKPSVFTVATIPARLAKLEADPWAEIDEARQTIPARVRKHVGI
jgi:bifunctional non-homologous end joining protein LigD